MIKVLVVGSTHGHERIGLEVIKELKKLKIPNDILEFEVGNPEASFKNVPLIESDLNRVFPGDSNGTYEERRAYELSPKIKSADIVIDIHSTNTTDLSSESMLIVTKYDEATKKVVDIMNPPVLLVMKYKGDNALISQAKVGIAFEYGNDKSESVLAATLYDIGKLLFNLGLLVNNPYTNIRPPTETKVFEVYDSFNKDFTGRYALDPAVENFKTVNRGKVVCVTEAGQQILANEDFVPILFGESRYTEILGFKARSIK
jgi:succinylglutamate desuccinylase